MTDQPQDPAPEPVPAPHETPLEHVADWFRHGHNEATATADLKAGATIAADAQALVHGHAASVLHVAAEILTLAARNPELDALLPKVLERGFVRGWRGFGGRVRLARCGFGHGRLL